MPQLNSQLELRRKRRTPVWLRLLWRLLLTLFLLSAALSVLWFERAGLRDNFDGKISFLDVLYFTAMTVTTVGYGDIVPVTPAARLVDIFALTPIRLLLWLVFLGTAYDFVLKGVWERWRMSWIQRNLRDHVVVAGYGASGAEAVRELLRRGVNAEAIVVVDQDVTATARAEGCGLTVLHGDATRNATLEMVHIAQAQSIIVCAGRDDTSILIVLTARGLAPRTPISVVIVAEDNELLAARAGANTVINPTSFAGLLLAGSTQGSHLAEAMADLAATGGLFRLNERPVMADEVGKALSSIKTGLGLRIYRAARPFGFSEIEANSLQSGDVIVEVVANDPIRSDAPAQGE